MTSIRFVFAAAVFAAFAFESMAAVGAPGADDTVPKALAAADRERLDRHRADVVEGLHAGSAAAWLEAYSDDVRLMPAYHLTVLGKTNAGAYDRAFLERFAVRESSRRALEQLDLGPQIAEFGQFVMALTHRESGRPIAVAGKYLDLWQRMPDGTLRLMTALWCHDRPPDDADLFRFATVPGVRMAHERELAPAHPWRFELAALNALEEIAIAQHDARTWSQFFADDAVIYANLGPIAKGRSAVDDYLRDHAQAFPVFEHLDVRTDRVDACGDVLVVYSSHVANWRTGDTSGVNTGKNVTLRRRQPDGAFKIIRSIGSYD